MWIVNALSIICSEMLKLSRNNQNIKVFGFPPNTLPLVIYIRIFCYWVLLHYIMSFKTIADGFNGAFLMVWSTFWRSRKFLTNLPKLSCGFKAQITLGFVFKILFFNNYSIYGFSIHHRFSHAPHYHIFAKFNDFFVIFEYIFTYIFLVHLCVYLCL